jgi:hypothetical protein
VVSSAPTIERAPEGSRVPWSSSWSSAVIGRCALMPSPMRTSCALPAGTSW